MSDNFPLHLAVLLFTSNSFDNEATAQLLFNSKERFLELELNDFLIYSHQNNLWWLFALWKALAFMVVLWFCATAPEKHKIQTRILFLLFVFYQLFQPIYYALYIS